MKPRRSLSFLVNLKSWTRLYGSNKTAHSGIYRTCLLNIMRNEFGVLNTVLLLERVIINWGVKTKRFYLHLYPVKLILLSPIKLYKRTIKNSFLFVDVCIKIVLTVPKYHSLGSKRDITHVWNIILICCSGFRTWLMVCVLMVSSTFTPLTQVCNSQYFTVLRKEVTNKTLNTTFGSW